MAAMGVVHRHTGDQPLDRNRSFATLALAGPGTGDRHDFLHLGVRLGAGEHGGDDFPSGEMPLADRRAAIGDAVALEALDDRLQRLFRHLVAFLAERLLQALAAARSEEHTSALQSLMRSS